MAKYCDSEVLERNWFEWIVANSVSVLEAYREQGLLWTKVVGKVLDEDGEMLTKTVAGKPRTFDDPHFPSRIHCIGLGRGIFVTTDAGEVGIVYADNLRPCGLPYTISPERLEGLASPGGFNTDPLVEAGFYLEKPASDSWQAILSDIFNICKGISTKFHLPSDQERNDLANDAVLQVMKKLEAGRLTYTPGRAPVFNLLTTTIHRCMFSALSKDQRRVKNARKYAEHYKTEHGSGFGSGTL